MARQPPGEITPQRELSQKLLGGQAVLESSPLTEMDSTRPVQRHAPGGAAAQQATAGAEGQPPTGPQPGSSAVTQPKLGSSVITQPKLGLGPAPGASLGFGPAPDSSRLHRSPADGMQVRRMPSFGDDFVDISNIDDPRQLREELLRSHRCIEQKEQEVINLEEQNLDLHEALNLEKQKVIDLKRAAKAQLEESQDAGRDLEMSRWLQEEVALLREETAKLQGQLEQAGQREHLLRAELADLRSAAGKADDQHSEEIGRLSMTMGQQLVQVEQELTQRTQELSQAIEPFLRHAHGLLSAARKACVQIEGASGRPRQAPPLYDLRSGDLAGSFRGILRLLRYMAEVLAQHTGMVNPFERGADACSIANTAASLASSAFDVAHSQTLRPATEFSQPGSQCQVLHGAKDVASLRCLGPSAGRAVDGDAEDTGPAVLRDEGAGRRWTCWLQE